MSELEDDLFFLAQNLALMVSPMEVGRRADQLVDHERLHNEHRPMPDDSWRAESDRLLELYWRMIRAPESIYDEIEADARGDQQQEPNE